MEMMPNGPDVPTGRTANRPAPERRNSRRATIQPSRALSQMVGRSPLSIRVSAVLGDTKDDEKKPSGFSQQACHAKRHNPLGRVKLSLRPAPQIFPCTRSNCLRHERCSGGCLVVLAIVYALLAAFISSSKPGATARPVGKYEPYDAVGCTECACHGKDVCEVRLSVAQEMKQPLMLQFQLESVYQNHRRYANSVSHAQLSRTPAQTSDSLAYTVPRPRLAPRTRRRHPARTLLLARAPSR